MSHLMRCLYCGLLQDEPTGAKECVRCGGELAFEQDIHPGTSDTYLKVQLELDQVQAPAGRNVDRFLLVTLCTPKQVPEQYAFRGAQRPPIHFVPVLDVSGSMSGEKLDQAKEALRQALHYLRDGDLFSLVIFSSEADCVVEPTTFDENMRTRVESLLKEIRAGGITALDGGLETGIERALHKQLPTTLVLLLSDGQANVGETDLEIIGLRAFKARQSGIVVSTLGIGADYNEALMSEIANQGGGRFYHLKDAAQIPAFMTGELGDAASIAARQVVVKLDLPPEAALVSLTSAYPVKQVGNTASVMVGSIPVDLELEVPLRLTFTSQKAGTRLSVSGQVQFQTPNDQTLQTPLNRVTVRFVEVNQFSERQGLAAPVVEKIALHRKAAFLLSYSRLRRTNPAAAQRIKEEGYALRDYMALADEKKAKEIEWALEEAVEVLSRGTPLAGKVIIADSSAFVRKSRDFDKK